MDDLKQRTVPGSELCSGPLKLVVTVPKTHQSMEEGVELRVWGADNYCHWGHVTKHNLREALHISKSQVLYTGHNHGGHMVINKVAKRAKERLR